MHASQILSDDTQGKQLGAGEQSDDRSQKGEAGNGVPVGEVPEKDVAQHQNAEEGECEAYQTGDL